MGVSGKIGVSGFAEFEAILSKLSSREVDRIAKKALYQGMGALANTIKQSTPKDTGSLKSSLGISRMQSNSGGGKFDVKVSHHGRDSKGTANILKARVLEKETGYYGKAVRRARPAAVARIKQVIESEFRKIGG